MLKMMLRLRATATKLYLIFDILNILIFIV